MLSAHPPTSLLKSSKPGLNKVGPRGLVPQSRFGSNHTHQNVYKSKNRVPVNRFGPMATMLGSPVKKNRKAGVGPSAIVQKKAGNVVGRMERDQSDDSEPPRRNSFKAPEEKSPSGKKKWQDGEAAGRKTSVSKLDKETMVRKAGSREKELAGFGNTSEGVAFREVKRKRVAVLEDIEGAGIAKRQKLAEAISDILPAKARFPKLGFENGTGYDCYRSSLLQALCNSPKFVNWIVRGHSPQTCCKERLLKDDGRTVNNCLTCFLRHLTCVYWSIPTGPKDTIRSESRADTTTLVSSAQRSIIRLCATNGFKVAGNTARGQGDPNDLLNFMLNTLASELPSDVANELNAICSVAFQQTISCKGCGWSSVTPVMDRGLPLQMVKSTEAPFQHYIQSYMGDVVEGYRCPKCEADKNLFTYEKLSKKPKVKHIISAPNVLSVHLQRYSLNPRSGRVVKDNRHIPYPSRLDLSKFCADTVEGGAAYELYSVICHGGQDNAGHYINLSKQPGTAQWWQYNDDRVSSATLQEALKPRTFHPYVLFYQKVVQ